MARKLTVYTGKGVGVFDLSVRPDMYTEPQAATIVMHDQEDHERVFTESEVRVMLDDIMGDDWRSISNPKTVAVSISRIVGIANTHGIVFDPA